MIAFLHRQQTAQTMLVAVSVYWWSFSQLLLVFLSTGPCCFQWNLLHLCSLTFRGDWMPSSSAACFRFLCMRPDEQCPCVFPYLHRFSIILNRTNLSIQPKALIDCSGEWSYWLLLPLHPEKRRPWCCTYGSGEGTFKGILVSCLAGGSQRKTNRKMRKIYWRFANFCQQAHTLKN